MRQVLPEHRDSVQSSQSALVTILRLIMVVLLAMNMAWPASALAAAKFEPPDGQSYFGFTQRVWDSASPGAGDTRPLADRLSDSLQYELGQKQPSVFGVPEIWQNASGGLIPFSTALTDINKFKATYSTAVPEITWNAQTGWGASDANYSGITTKTINGGSLDPYITQYAQDVKAYGQPLFIRLICGEVNGSWWKSCSPNANPNLTKTDFINAWRRVVDIFRANGVTNVSWVWNAMTFPRPPANWGIDTDFAGYYPGDDYVDWVGVDHYDYGNLADTNTNPLTPEVYLDPHYNFAVQHNKPFFLAEWGVRHNGSSMTPAQESQWISLMFDYLASHPKIKAHLYFNYDNNFAQPTLNAAWSYNSTVNYEPNVNDQDHRLLSDSGQGWRALFLSRILDPRFATLFFNDVIPPVISNVGTSNLNMTGAMVNWSTDEPASSQVDYGITSAYGQKTTVGGLGTGHAVGLSNLTPNTTYHFRVVSQDGSGNTATSQDLTFTTAADTASPTVSITSPANNARVSRNSLVNIAATATDNVGVTRVEIYVNGSLLCTDTSGPYGCGWSVPKNSNATYRLTAQAYDAAGNKSVSSTVTVTAK